MANVTSLNTLPPPLLADPATAPHAVPELRMLKLLDRQSGVCLFTEQWKWHPHAHPEGVDALVQSFTQFAREIDGGGAQIYACKQAGQSRLRRLLCTLRMGVLTG